MNAPALSTCSYANCALQISDSAQRRCILHSEDLQKDKRQFDSAVAEKLASNDFDFSGVVFPAKVDFRGRVISKGSFREATFVDFARFDSVRFEGVTTFLNAKFKGGATFQNAQFAGFADFRRCDFGEIFAVKATFNDAQFLGPATFAGATFHLGAEFINASFAGPAYFVGVTFVAPVNFRAAGFQDFVDFTMALFQGKGVFVYGSPFKFKCIDAAGTFFEASFKGAAYFVACGFDNVVDFELAQFRGAAVFTLARPPGNPKVCFEGVVCEDPERVSFDRFDISRITFLNTNLQKIRFHNVAWPRTASRIALYDEQQNRAASGERLLRDEKQDREAIRILYRDLKMNFDAAGDWVAAGDFYYAEMEIARRRHPRRTTRWLLSLYWFLAGYGERPVHALLVFIGMIVCLSILFMLPWAGFTVELTPHNTVNWHLSPLEAIGHSVRAVFIRAPFFQPQTKWAHAFTLTGNIAGASQLTLLAIALRRWLRR
jgi:uncharacterized protein YjbI with pentapeptide repeats